MFGPDVDLKTLAWPASMLGEAIELLAHKRGLAQHLAHLPSPPANLERAGEELLGQWVQAVANHLKLEAESIIAPYAEVEQLLYNAGPALLQLPASFDAGQPRFLALLKGNKRRLSLVGPDLSLHRVRPDLVRAALCRELETPVTQRADRVLALMGIPNQRRARARPAIAQKQIGATQVNVGWILRLPPGASLWRLARRVSLRGTFLMLGPHVVQQALEFGAWAVIGKAAFSGRFDQAWLWAWALLLFTAVLFEMLSDWAEIPLVSNIGGLFKWKLLYGALKLNPDDVRHQGAGQFMGRVLESQWLELLAAGGGLNALLVGVVLFIATVPLFAGAGSWYHAVLLGLWTAFALVLTRLSYRRTCASINAYRDMTNDLVEQMVGHRTRLAQQDSARWHDEEDRALARYVELCKQGYPIETMLLALIPRGWMVLGLAGVAYAFVFAPGSSSQIRLALSLGGVLLVFQSLTMFVTSLQSMATASAMRIQIEPLLQAAARPVQDQIAAFALLTKPKQEHPQDKRTVLAARGVNFRYRPGSRLVLQGCNLQIREGDRWLLEGPSGGGKSTLAALLAGMRMPQSGLIQLRGFDRQTVSTAIWRRRVVIAPQFHENHVFTESLAFNLLMGRRWPPRPQDLLEAETVCRELGLGDLLGRMPDGLLQVIGEGGWRLSHGERSRLYIARAILQEADLVILDESFGALDPESLQRALRCVHDRAKTVLVIAHP
jgi:ATP-binding cassette subfamily B protein